MVLRRSRITKELRQGMPSTGLCRVIRIRNCVLSEPLSQKMPVLPHMLILISFHRVATPFKTFQQIFLKRAP